MREKGIIGMFYEPKTEIGKSAVLVEILSLISLIISFGVVVYLLVL